MQSNGNSYSSQNDTAALEAGTTVSHKFNYSLAIWCNKHACRYLANWLKNVCFHKNLHVNVCNSFIHNQQKLELINMSFSGWIDNRLRYSYTKDYYSVIKRNELLSYENTCMNFKCIFVSERNQSEKAIHTLWSQLYDILKKVKLYRRQKDQ